jgi:hypothetical protein
MTAETSGPPVGVAAYQIGDGLLDGVWTFNNPELAGKLGTERAVGGTPGQLPGLYEVTIWDPQGDEIFRGTLRVTATEATYHLTWEGRNPAGKEARYEGQGVRLGDVLAVDYWPA